MNKTIYERLLEVQKEIGAIKKDSENPFYKSMYFDINSLLAVVKPALNKHGLVLTQALSNIEGKLALRTTISLPENDDRASTNPVGSQNYENITDICPLPDGLDAQKQGSAITYFRRYAIVSLLALEAEDDDANSVSDVKKTKSFAKPTQLATQKQKDYLQKMLTQKGLNPLTDEELNELTMAKASELIEKNKF